MNLFHIEMTMSKGLIICGFKAFIMFMMSFLSDLKLL